MEDGGFPMEVTGPSNVDLFEGEGTGIKVCVRPLAHHGSSDCTAENRALGQLRECSQMVGPAIHWRMHETVKTGTDPRRAL